MNRGPIFYVSTFLFCLLLITLWASPVAADGPQRGVEFTTPYPDMMFPIDNETIEVSVNIANKGQSSEEVRLSAFGPDGWEYRFEAGYPKRTVRQVFLTSPEANEDESEQKLTFKVTPPEDVEPGDYQFALEARSIDGAVASSLRVTIGLSPAEETVTEEAGVELTADSTTVEQLAGRNFTFGVNLHNKGEEEQRFEFVLLPAKAEIPLNGWLAYVTKGYGDTRISNLLVKGGATERIELTLTPPPDVTAGEYPIILRAFAEGISDEIELTAKVAGTYKLNLTTSIDNPRYNIDANAGKATHISLVLENQGSAPLQNISFSSSKPEGWTVTFNPDSLESFEPGATQAIDVTVEPSKKAIAGDYMITLRANSSNSSDSVDFRVEVETSTSWGWVGVAIVVVVVAALLGIFFKLRRR